VFAPGPLPCELFADPFGRLCIGEVLEGLTGITPPFDQWLAAERACFHEQITLRLESELERHRQDDPAGRAALARRLISFDPTHEGASRILMRALADMGERAQAIREYERCRSALGMLLDLEPSKQTRALCQALRMAG
jgi:DNA-binding SARP family transcriptional activator